LTALRAVVDPQLNALAGRVLFIKGATLTGQLLVNGRERDEEDFKHISAYCTQDDYLYAFLTVHETLSMAASFYMASTVPQEEKAAQVEAVIAELGA
jgi:ABC-type multidrug transport system ATPase subunit